MPPFTTLIALHVAVKRCSAPSLSHSWKCKTDTNATPTNYLAVQVTHSLFCIVLIPEHNECKTRRCSRHPHFFESAVLLEGTLEVLLSNIDGNISNVNSRSFDVRTPASTAAPAATSRIRTAPASHSLTSYRVTILYSILYIYEQYQAEYLTG